ncbi:MAG: Gfo/Idh/MocA family oxidoreductase [Myxococcota bacterium]
MGTQAKLKWAVVGVGIAGRARAKAIVDDPRARLVAVHRGRYAGEVGAPEVDTLAEALALADAVAICSPTALHPEHVEAALRAGRHVVVEFPLAATAKRAEELFALADEVGRVLHVEHIELLDPPSSTLRAHVRREVVEHVDVYFERPGAEGASQDTLALGNVARLHRVTALTGPLGRLDEVEYDGRALTARLTLPNGGTVRASFDQAPDLRRRTVLRVRSAGGTTWEQVNGTLTRNGAPQTLLGVGSLFRRDQIEASSIILDGTADYVSRERVLHVLDVVEAMARSEIGGFPHRSAA